MDRKLKRGRDVLNIVTTPEFPATLHRVTFVVFMNSYYVKKAPKTDGPIHVDTINDKKDKKVNRVDLIRLSLRGQKNLVFVATSYMENSLYMNNKALPISKSSINQKYLIT